MGIWFKLFGKGQGGSCCVKIEEIKDEKEGCCDIKIEEVKDEKNDCCTQK